MTTDSAPATPTPATAPAAQEPARPGRNRRGGQRRRSPQASAPGAAAPAPAVAAVKGPRTHPLLEQLAAWYPRLFGAEPLPLKRGIFEDLLAAHPEALERDQLKQALALHARSTRYLTVVAGGQQRHDLQGVPVEALAPEHVHHALLEVFRRRQQRVQEDLTPKLRQRIVKAFEASGLTREEYAERVRGRDDKANALLDEALAEAAARAARDEALLRAFEASGQPEAAFADMYGLPVRQVADTLARARQRRAVGGA